MHNLTFRNVNFHYDIHVYTEIYSLRICTQAYVAELHIHYVICMALNTSGQSINQSSIGYNTVWSVQPVALVD